MAEKAVDRGTEEAVLVHAAGREYDLSRAGALRARGLEVEALARADDRILPHLRHSCAHVLAQAVQELFPGTLVCFGPPTGDGFYYDFCRETPFSTDDFARIEERMAEIVARDLPFVREVWDRERARAWFADRGERFKAEHVLSLAADEEITVYRQGDWLDLCRGPHLPSTGHIGGGFRLLRVSGAYWRGDARSGESLQRIYGTCWRDRGELATYLHALEEAERRDHRRIGREMGLFHLQEEARGGVFWHPGGWALYRALESYLRRRLSGAGYVEVRTPQVYERSLWERSGHWSKFREHMFTLADRGGDGPVAGDGAGEEGETALLALKPMNCPAHVEIFRRRVTSYRDLPLRMAEFGCCHRYEPSGALHGLMRVRAFTQDDAHIFCTPEQIVPEVSGFCTLLRQVYADCGFTEVRVRFADRPEVRAGDDALWDQAEAALRQATEAAGLPVEENPGEGAFYGPKLEFVLADAIGRQWQCGTMQVDFVLPGRLDASYVGPDGARHRPVMLHRAILGSFERFIGILIEHYEGRFPVWLAPVQVVVASIAGTAADYAAAVCARLRACGLRVGCDVRGEKISYKVREHSTARVPFILVCGQREAAEGSVSVRRLGERHTRQLPLDEALTLLLAAASPPDLAVGADGAADGSP